MRMNYPTVSRSYSNSSQVCELEKDAGSRKEFIAALAVPFLVNDGQFVAYESERSVQMKVR